MTKCSAKLHDAPLTREAVRARVIAKMPAHRNLNDGGLIADVSEMFQSMKVRRQTFVLWTVNLLVVVVVSYAHDAFQLDFKLNGSEHDIVLTFLALLHAFRTNQAYDRWWEGRKLWGQITNSCRNAASNAAVWVRDGSRRRRIIMHMIVLPWAIKAAVRKKRITSLEMSRLISDSELYEYNKAVNIPMGIVDAIRSEMRAELQEQRQTLQASAADTLPPVHSISPNWDLILSNDIQALVDAEGACERIAFTPMPLTSLAQLRVFTLVWLFTYPFAISMEYSLSFTVPITATISYVLLALDDMVLRLSSPFGEGRHDLQLESICCSIEIVLMEILERAAGGDVKVN
eukprot:CAMPEP_0119325306 /NCGR_PEP_ID=MMETSP1333-20130426/65475_1 /TAXON_ID=418940 /ORGANISM="Scyphosphaera apsteinii, Strain RCC1455" /LENGTH=344 /DNA_ID=CAMNT_0007333261 /DNA_START=105 /DNA_END=1139 /DNA_ORIENTATION=-